MKKSLLFKNITKYWLYLTAVYILMSSLIIKGNIYFLLFNVLGIGIMTYLTSYYTYKETNKKDSTSKMLKTYLIIFTILVFLSTSVFRGHHLSLNLDNLSFYNINLIPLKSTISDIKDIINGKYNNLTLILGNLLLLVPLAYLYPRNIKKNNFLKTALACLFTSFFLEVFQFIFSVGQFDIDDIILNTLGPILFYPIFNKGSVSKIMDNIFYFKNAKMTKKDWLVLGLVIVIFLIIIYILVYDYWFKVAGYGLSYYMEKPCINDKVLAYSDTDYNYYYTCSNTSDIYLEYSEDVLGFNVKTKYKVEDIINGKVTDKRFRLQEILDSEYFIYEEK